MRKFQYVTEDTICRNCGAEVQATSEEIVQTDGYSRQVTVAFDNADASATYCSNRCVNEDSARLAAELGAEEADLASRSTERLANDFRIMEMWHHVEPLEGDMAARRVEVALELARRVVSGALVPIQAPAPKEEPRPVLSLSSSCAVSFSGEHLAVTVTGPEFGAAAMCAACGNGLDLNA